MSALARLWPDNPVLTKELRVRMRGARAYWILTGYLAILSFILFMQYSLWWNTARMAGGGFSMGSKIGKTFFEVIFYTQLFLVVFITPAVTSGAITIEKEQRTMDMLEMTRIPRSGIVAGKLLSAVSFIALLLVASLPLTSICFFLGGVSPEEVVQRYLLLLGVSFVTAALGLVWSTVARTTAAAVIFTYSSLLAPYVMLIPIAIFSGSAASSSVGSPMNPGLLLTILAGICGAMMPEWLNQFTPYQAVIHAWDLRHYYGLTLPVWLAPTLTFALLGLTLAAVATVRLESFPERKAGLLRGLVLAFFVEQLFFLFGARFTVYSSGAAPGSAAASSGFPLIYLLTYPVALLLICVPIFTTGEVRPIEARRLAGYLAAGWTWTGLKRGRISSGLPFLLGVLTVSIALYCLSFVMVGRPGALVHGIPGAAVRIAPPAPVIMPNGSAVTVQPGTTLHSEAPGRQLVHVVAAALAALVGLSALGFLFSVAVRNRWAALALLYVVVVAILVLPAIARENYANDYSRQMRAGPSIFINLYYLDPLMPIAEASDASGKFWSDMNLMFGQAPIWEGCVIGWLFITGVSCVLALPFVQRIAASPAIAYEDMAARV